MNWWSILGEVPDATPALPIKNTFLNCNKTSLHQFLWITFKSGWSSLQKASDSPVVEIQYKASFKWGLCKLWSKPLAKALLWSWNQSAVFCMCSTTRRTTAYGWILFQVQCCLLDLPCSWSCVSFISFLFFFLPFFLTWKKLCLSSRYSSISLVSYCTFGGHWFQLSVSGKLNCCFPPVYADSWYSFCFPHRLRL